MEIIRTNDQTSSFNKYETYYIADSQMFNY